MDVKYYSVVAVLLAVGLIICFIIGGLKLAIVYTMLWIDKIIIGKLKKPLEFGIELYSLPAILVGIAYGPATGFLFGFLAIPIIAGFLDVVPCLVCEFHELDTGWGPFIPSFESVISGIIGAIAGLLGQFLPFIFIVAICILVRFFISVIKDGVLRMPPKIIAYLINLGLNIGIAFLLQSFFISIFF
jgi:hypothetical protein